MLQLLSGCLHCDCHLSMARLFYRFDPDREKGYSYLMRPEFCVDSNNITTDQKKKAALCSIMSTETFTILQNVLTREVTDVSCEELKTALKQHFEETIFSMRVSISSARFSRKVNQSLISWLNCAIMPMSVTLFLPSFSTRCPSKPTAQTGR